MHKLHIKPVWVLRDHPDGERFMPRLLSLLAAIHETGSLARACGRTGDSYRHGWGMLREAKQAFGEQLVASVRGRGAKLTALGERLLWADKRIAARLAPAMEGLATEVEAELVRASANARGVMRICASHAFAVAALRDFLARRHIPVELAYLGSSESLAAFHRGECDIAGFHVPRGELEEPMLAAYAKCLKPGAHILVDLVERRQGLIVARDNPRKIASIEDLAKPRVRFVNRQPGSATRQILDHLLARQGIDASRIDGYDRIEFTHGAVAAFIASGMADAGLGVETAARHFHLGFVPILTERYFLALRREALESPGIERLLAVMRSKEFRMQLIELQELDASRCGEVEEVAEAFPRLAPAPGRAKRKAR